MNQRRDKPGKPHVSPRDAGRLRTTSKPFQPAPKALWYNLTAIGFLIGAFLIIHNLSMESREWILIGFAFGAIPVSILLSCLPRPLHYWGIYASTFSLCLGIMCCGDMGGPHAHYLTGGMVAMAGLVALFPSAAIILTRGVYYRAERRASLGQAVSTQRFRGEMPG